MILIVTQWYPTPEIPVGGIFVRVHATSLRRRAKSFGGVPVTVVHLDREAPWSVRQRHTVDGGEEIRLGTRIENPWVRKALKAMVFPLPIATALRVNREIASRTGPRVTSVVSVVHPAEIVSWLIAKRYRCPFTAHIEHSTSFTVRDPQFPQSKAIRRIRGWWLRRPGQVVTVSKPLAESLHTNFGVARTRVVANGVDDAYVLAPSRPISPGVLRIISVSLLTRNKRVDEIIRAAALINDRSAGFTVQVEIVGEGPQREELEALAGGSGIAEATTFHGFLAPTAIADLASDCSVFVLASDFETFCVAAAESLAVGLPIVATRCGGPDSYIPEELATFLDVLPKSPAGAELLADAILAEVARDTTDRRENAREFAKKIVSIDAVGQDLWEATSPPVEMHESS